MALHILNCTVKRNKMHPLIGEVIERLHQRAICSKEPYCSMLTESYRDKHNINALKMYLKELFVKNENPVIIYLPSCCFKTIMPFLEGHSELISNLGENAYNCLLLCTTYTHQFIVSKSRFSNS